jgi:hypothetical protein
LRIYKWSLIFTGLLAIISLSGVFILHFVFTKIDDLWFNILLGVFGSGLLTFITSIIGYRVERKRTLEAFANYTKKILHELNKYQKSFSRDEKLDFFLACNDTDRIDWAREFGNICFIFDYKKKNSQYIYSQIYQLIMQIEQEIINHVWHFRWHKDGSGRNEAAMERFIQDVEPLIIEAIVDKMPGEFSENGTVLDWTTITSTKNRIFESIMRELNGKYYKILYGKQTYNREFAKENQHG